MAVLRLECLGGFRVLGPDGAPLAIPGAKNRALLAYLACAGPQPREALMALLWGGRFESQARQSLRKALSALRRALGETADSIITLDDRVALDPGIWGCDAPRLRELVTEGTPEALQEAAALYRGDFLVGLSAGTEEFERWLETERARLRSLAVDALAGRARIELDRDDGPAAVELARRATALDALREDAQRVLMQSLAASGHRLEALRRYRDLETLLQRELDVRPEAETRRVFEAIQAGSPATRSATVQASAWEDQAGGERIGTLNDVQSLPLPDKPSIAVLPFENMNSDPEQEYFSDGITEDIITELSRFRSLFVISRHSSFVYKGRSVGVRQIGRELGVRYVAEGSVRRAGNRVRISVQLIEAETGSHLWAERYDRELDDIFAVQDEVTQAIVGALPGRLGEAAIAHARRKPAESLSAYDCLLRGEWYLRGDHHHPHATAMFERAIQIDPQCARAFARLAICHGSFTHGGRTEDNVLQARTFAERALAVDNDDPLVNSIAAAAYVLVGDHDLARRHMQAAIMLNPNDAHVIYYAALTLTYHGNHAEAQRWIDKARRLDPHIWEPFREVLFDASYMNHEYEGAIDTFKEWRHPLGFLFPALAAAYAQLGRMDKAYAAVARFNQDIPKRFDFSAVASAHAGMCKRKEDADHWLDGYRKAGLL